MEGSEKALGLMILLVWIVPPIVFIPFGEVKVFMLWIPALMFTVIWGFLYFSLKNYDKEHNRMMNENEAYYKRMQNLGKG